MKSILTAKASKELQEKVKQELQKEDPDLDMTKAILKKFEEKDENTGGDDGIPSSGNN